MRAQTFAHHTTDLRLSLHDSRAFFIYHIDTRGNFKLTGVL